VVIKEIYMEHFGKFHGKKVEFSKGTNIVYGENEAGKTTIHTFIRGMLFGIDKVRGRGSTQDVYTRYEPWETPGSYSGSMSIVQNGINYRIERNFNKDNKSMAVINVDEGRELSKEEIESLFSGFDESSYYNTISVSQLGSATDKELEIILKNYAANLMSTKSTELDMNKAVETLKGKRREIKSEAGNDTESSLKNSLKELMGGIEETERLESSLEERIAGNKENLNMLTKRQGELEKKQSDLEKEYYTKKGKIEVLSSTKADLEKDIEGLVKKDEELKNNRLESNDRLREAGIKDEEDLEQLRVTAIKRKTSPGVLSIIMMILYIAVAAVFFGAYFLEFNIPYIARGNVYLYIGAVALVLFLVFLIEGLVAAKKNKKKKDYELKLHKELSVVLEENNKLLKTRTALEEEIRTKRKKLYDLNREMMEENAEAQSEEDSQISDEAQREKELKMEAQRQEAERINEQKRAETKDELIKIIDRVASLKDAISKDEWNLEKSKEALENLYNERDELINKIDAIKEVEKEVSAIDLAIKNIEDIGKDVRDSFGNNLNDVASFYLDKLTNGKYNKLYIDDKLNISVNSPDRLIKSSHLSKGTLEQIYLCLRLAAAGVLFADDPKPILMDDAMAMYDNKRMGAAIKFMDESVEQVIIFSCHTREKVMADKLGLDYNLIRL